MDELADLAGLGGRVKERRVASGLSQAALADNVNISASYISLIESGRRGTNAKLLAELADELHTTVAFLRFGARGAADDQIQLAVDFSLLELNAGDAGSARARLEVLDFDAASPSVRARGLTVLARAHEISGDLEPAIEILEGLVVEALAREHLIDAATAATALTGCLILAGDLRRADNVGERVLVTMEDAALAGTDEHLRLGATLLWASIEAGDLVTASRRATQLIRQGEALGTPRGRGSVYWNAALLAEERRNFALAKRYTERALALLGEYDSGRDLPRLRLHYAHLLSVSTPPAPEAALEQLDRAGLAIQLGGSTFDLATLHLERARALLALGLPQTASELATKALEILDEPSRLEASEAQLVLGDALQSLGDTDAALTAYRVAAERLAAMSATRRAATAWRKLAERYRALGHLHLALDAYSRGMDEAGVPAPTVPANTEVARTDPADVSR